MSKSIEELAEKYNPFSESCNGIMFKNGPNPIDNMLFIMGELDKIREENRLYKSNTTRKINALEREIKALKKLSND